MARNVENACVGCAECIGCGRKYREDILYTCDSCGCLDDNLYEHNGKMYCEDCITNEFPQKEIYEGETDTCDECEREPHNDTLYLYDGQWLCLHCFLQQFDKVNQDE